MTLNNAGDRKKKITTEYEPYTNPKSSYKPRNNDDDDDNGRFFMISYNMCLDLPIASSLQLHKMKT